MSMPLRASDPAWLGPYELIGRLGAGGMGTVYLGRDPAGRRVAVKAIRSEYAWDDELRRRFRSEVSRVRQVPPFSTAAVLDADLEHDPPYLVVEYVEGPSLAEVIRERGPLGPEALHSLAVGMATALVAIHGAGVIHRDLKPANVLFALGGVKVIDFGIARAFEATSHHTRTDQMVGTIAYMAPERFEADAGSTVTAAADIFAWGVVVAHAATGRAPFGGDSAPSTAMRILTQPPDLTGITGPLRDLISRALVKDPRNRPTARELLNALLANDDSPQLATEVKQPAPTRRRPRLLATTAALVALLCAAGVSWALIGSKPTANRKAALTASSTPAADQQLGGTAAAASAPTATSSPAFDSPADSLSMAATPAAMVELVSLLLPDRKISHARAIGDALSIQLYLDAGDGPGLISIDIDGPSPAKPRSRARAPKVKVDNLPDNCLQSTLVTVDWPDGTVLLLADATCLAWDGKQNKRAPQPLTTREAVAVATDPRWGTTMDQDLVTAGTKHFRNLR